MVVFGSTYREIYRYIFYHPVVHTTMVISDMASCIL